jgi:GT2 family glycosyltransferase
MKIIACMTSHNRSEATTKCLAHLHSEALDNDVELQLILVDAGSKDGTADKVSILYHNSIVVRESDDVYWAQGMRIAMRIATEFEYDALMWLNDDTYLTSGGLGAMLDLLPDRQRPEIVVGATKELSSEQLTYGGYSSQRTPFGPSLKALPVSGHPEPCATMNGNVVLLTRGCVETLGNIDPGFVHGLGDFDYGLRATRRGIPVWQVPGFVACCDREERKNARTGPIKAIRRAASVKFTPLRPWLLYTRRHGGFLWWVSFVQPYVKAFLTGM